MVGSVGGVCTACTEAACCSRCVPRFFNVSLSRACVCGVCLTWPFDGHEQSRGSRHHLQGTMLPVCRLYFLETC